MTVELELDGSTRPPTPEEQQIIERIRAMLMANSMGWNHLRWRPPIQGTSLVIKPACTNCEHQGLPLFIPAASPNDAGLRAHLERLGTHRCAVA